MSASEELSLISIDNKLPSLVSGAVNIVQGLSIPKYDYVALAYSGSNLTDVTYKTGGVSGTTVGAVTLAYDVNNNLTSVTKL